MILLTFKKHSAATACSFLYLTSAIVVAQGYKVYYTLTPDLPVIDQWTLHVVNDNKLTTISNLLTNRTYTISMLAYTSVGDGPLSQPIQVKTQQGGT